MIQLNTTMPAAIQFRPTFYREALSYMYAPLVKVASEMTVELPWMAGIVLATLPISYFLLGLSSDAGTFFFHYLATLVLCFTYWCLGAALAALLPTFEVIQALAGVLMPLFFLFGGLWSPPSQMASGASWFCYIDPITYAFKALIPPHFYCAGAGTPAGAGCPTLSVISLQGQSTAPVYSFVSNKYEVYYSDRWSNLGYLSLFIVVFAGVAVLATQFVRHIVR
jgi:ATP-binding cassette subfamily G (WHITE) protein 2 (SNQ2)